MRWENILKTEFFSMANIYWIIFLWSSNDIALILILIKFHGHCLHFIVPFQVRTYIWWLAFWTVDGYIDYNIFIWSEVIFNSHRDTPLSTIFKFQFWFKTKWDKRRQIVVIQSCQLVGMSLVFKAKWSLLWLCLYWHSII